MNELKVESSRIDLVFVEEWTEKRNIFFLIGQTRIKRIPMEKNWSNSIKTISLTFFFLVFYRQTNVILIMFFDVFLINNRIAFSPFVPKQMIGHEKKSINAAAQWKILFSLINSTIINQKFLIKNTGFYEYLFEFFSYVNVKGKSSIFCWDIGLNCQIGFTWVFFHCLPIEKSLF